MKKEFSLIYKDGRFILSSKGNPEGEYFSIDEDSLQFDTRKYYEGIFHDVNEYIEIEISHDENTLKALDNEKQKKARYIYESIKYITQEICTKLNEQCFTCESTE